MVRWCRGIRRRRKKKEKLTGTERLMYICCKILQMVKTGERESGRLNERQTPKKKEKCG
jgi:hypothetical protein